MIKYISDINYHGKILDNSYFGEILEPSMHHTIRKELCTTLQPALLSILKSVAAMQWRLQLKVNEDEKKNCFENSL